ncbi:hypothetical protein COCCADRAFT_32958 [Bipolaris zeicola 26-R-13]|uniref:Cyanovirin-N domain-containing protein n=1 Tax=Cochliobolus carbonum (strain 26-R-13) TaxID=930089 RepID=W6YEF3_COCC2|nr:uncharacterized protein COCCADRAFT_32958 [Bipolaris zeicola 26-R-13]EUC37857.1 hypothetical protein COCCADRAFT_32958 [Bipolaris zeicola 26-R-13]
MHFATTLFAAVLALLPSVQAEIPSGNWMQLDCYVGYVYKDGQLLDTNHNLHYDWQLTAQACNNNYASSVAKYSIGRGRCIAYTSDGLNGADWWENCKKQAQNGWYDVDRITGDVVINGSPYKAYDAEGRGY